MAAPRGPCGAYAAYAFIYLYYIVYIYIYNGYSEPSVDRKGIQPIGSSGVINPTFFTNLFHVGLKSHTFVLSAGHVERYEASDWRRIGNPRVDRVDAWTTDRVDTCLLKRVITATIQSRGEDLTRRIKIQRQRLKAFYNACFKGFIRTDGSQSNSYEMTRF